MQRLAANERRDATAGVGAFGMEAGADGTGMSADTAEAFRGALWFFVEPSPIADRALLAAETVAVADDVGKLVKRPNGRFGIVTKRLNVQLKEDISEQDAERVLADRGAGIRVAVIRQRFQRRPRGSSGGCGRRVRVLPAGRRHPGPGPNRGRNRVRPACLHRRDRARPGLSSCGPPVGCRLHDRRLPARVAA